MYILEHNYEQDEGDLRIVSGMVIHPSDEQTIGLLVQQLVPRTDNEGYQLCGYSVWETVCPLVDFSELYPGRVNDLPSMR